MIGMQPPARRELTVVLLVAAVQFVNILDFVMVMPLGPDFAVALGIPVSTLGLVGGSYTAAAAAAGLIGSLFLDRFDRRPALGIAMLGLVAGTALGGFATSLPTLLASRMVAGAFGGPATSLSFSIVADVVPQERRGRAMGIVMGAFSIAQVFGVPAGLELARQLGWRAPFIVVAGIGVLIAACAVLLLPPLRGHLQGRKELVPLSQLVAQRNVRLSWAMTFVAMAGGFVLIPNLSAYVQYNLGYPRARLGLLYFVAGLVSLVGLQLAGRITDRFGSFRTGSAGSLLLAVTIFGGFVLQPPPVPVLGIFVPFMLAMSFRNVAYNTLTSKVPRPDERARFMSIQSSVQHTASALGAFLSARMLGSRPDGSLAGMDHVALVAIALTLALPLFLFGVESSVRRRPATPLVPAPELQ
jgi:predicted MFS family arabinose efflux permease